VNDRVFFTLINEWGSHHEHVDRGESSGTFSPILFVIAPSGDDAWLIVILDEQSVPAIALTRRPTSSPPDSFLRIGRSCRKRLSSLL
jgi:hypothetical protein